MKSFRRVLSIILVLLMLICSSSVFAAGVPEEGSEADTALFNFENGVQGFSGTNGSILSTSNEQVFAGSQSLKMTLQTNKDVGPFAKLWQPAGLVAGDKLEFHVWVPDTENITGVQPYIMDATWSWTGNMINYGALQKGQWNTINLTIPTNAKAPINELGVQLVAKAGFDGSIYIDSIAKVEVPVDETPVESPLDLRKIQVNGEEVPAFAKGKLSYNVHVPSTTISAAITVETTTSAAITVITGDEALQDGENDFTVKVTADETERTYNIKVIRALPIDTAKRITIQRSKFYAGQNEIFINGANTPWDNWNDFGGDFDFAWWDNHFRELKSNGANASRIWITCNGDVGIDIDENGVVTGATAAHWNDLDSLFYIAQKHGIYIMATLLSFDHFKNTYVKYESWRKMLESDVNIDSYVENYVIPFTNRYKDNPYLWSIDLMNEPDWVFEDARCGQYSWERMQKLFAKMSVAIHENSEVLTTVGVAMVKYNSDEDIDGAQGNMVGDQVLMSKADGNPLAKIDFWSGHYYDWMGQYWGVPMYITPAQFGMTTDRPSVIGETPANGTSGNTLTADFLNAYENGWSGVMPWTSNGVDWNGGMAQVAPAVRALAELYPERVTPTAISVDAYLSDLRIDDLSLAGFDKDEYSYSINVTSSAISVVAITNNPFATYEVSGNESLVVGENTVTVEVTAGDGITKKNYTIKVIRAEAPPVVNPPVSTDTAVPQNESSATIAAGKAGKLTFSDKVTIDLPAGAMEQDVKITIKELTNISNLVSKNDVLLSPVFEILKNRSENFKNPIKLTFKFDLKLIGKGQKPSVFYYNEEQKKWVEIGGAAAENLITAEVDHFTKFAVFAVEEKKVDPTVEFSDIDDHWAAEKISAAVKAGIVMGYPDGTFRPEVSVTRAQFAVMMVKALGLKGEVTNLTFVDNADIPSWARNAVELCVREGIISGYTDRTFKPNRIITRAEMVTMIYNSLDLTESYSSSVSFADNAKIPVWAKEAATAALKLNIIKVKADEYFNSYEIQTRAQAIDAIMNMLSVKK